jgi:hypothetical protein
MLLEFLTLSKFVIFGITCSMIRSCSLKYIFFWRGTVFTVIAHLLVAHADVAGPIVLITLGLIIVDVY